MSMLSAQVDELRELATRYDELQVCAVKAVTMPSNMGSILRDAADTIWELRDDLQRANAENAKLRELVEDMLDCIDIRIAFGRPLTSEMYEGFAQRACELGIEVEE